MQINDYGLYSVGIVEMVTREITKKSYRETAKTLSEDTDDIYEEGKLKEQKKYSN